MDAGLSSARPPLSLFTNGPRRNRHPAALSFGNDAISSYGLTDTVAPAIFSCAYPAWLAGA